jgi:hypothetical protein
MLAVRDSQKLAAEKVNRAAGPAAVLDRSPNDPVRERARRDLTERPLGPVDDDRAQGLGEIGSDLHERTERDSGNQRDLEVPERVRSPSKDGPEGRNPELSLGEESVGSCERPDDRGEVRTSDADVVEDDDRGTRFPTEATQKAGQDLGHRKPSPIEAVVDASEELGGDSMSSSEEARSDRQEAGERLAEFGTHAFHDRPRRPACDRRGAAPGRPGDRHHPRRRCSRTRRVQPLYHLFDFASTPESHRGEPVMGQHFRMRRGHH